MKAGEALDNATVMITGGTGSFGNAVLDRLISSRVKEVRIFSRDEKKQHDMRTKYNNSKIVFIIGDVRDGGSVRSAMDGVDHVFHAAALKQVPSCEFYPLEAVKTNVLGTSNVIDAAISCKIESLVCLSTDKAVYPINAMGISKAMMEKVIVAKARQSRSTRICITRYGNVMASRGSVIPLFVNQVQSGNAISITDPAMTRFMMSLEEAVDLVLYAFENGDQGQLYVQKSPGATIKVLASAILDIFGARNTSINIIGSRHGEKLHEVLVSREEMAVAKDLGKYFCISPDMRDLNYEKYYSTGGLSVSSQEEYSSINTDQLDVSSMVEKLKSINYIQKIIQ